MANTLGDLGQGFWDTGLNYSLNGGPATSTTIGNVFGMTETPAQKAAREARTAGMNQQLQDAFTNVDDATRRAWYGGFNGDGNFVRQKAQGLVDLYRQLATSGDTAGAQTVKGLMQRLTSERGEAKDVIDSQVPQIDSTVAAATDANTTSQAMDAERQRLAATDPYAKMANPYTDGNPGMLALLAQEQGAIGKQYSSAEDDARRSLAQRGMLGSGQETSLLNQLAMNRAAALSGAESDLRAKNYQAADDFNRWRTAGSAGWMQGGQQLAQQNVQFNQQLGYNRWRDTMGYSRDDRNYRDQQDGQFWGNAGTTAATAAELGAKYGPAVMDAINKWSGGNNPSPNPSGGGGGNGGTPTAPNTGLSGMSLGSPNLSNPYPRLDRSY